MTTPVSVGIHVPSSAVAPLGPGEAYAEFFRQVEALGLDAVWTEDRIFHPANVLDPLLLLASAATCTRRIQLGTAVLVLTLRHAAVVARQVSTLHHLSGGRLALGVSLGGRPEEYLAAGVPMKRRVAVFRESVTVLRRLLAGEPVDFQGQFVRLEQATVRPSAPVPLYVGGHAEGALRRAGELADGWIMGPFGTVVDFPDVDQHAIFGPSAEVAARLRAHVDAGITRLMLGVPTLDLAHLRRVAEEVAPAVRGSRASVR